MKFLAEVKILILTGPFWLFYRAQEKGDHYAALMMSVASGSGSSSYTSNLILKYLDLMQELKADVHLDEDRLRLYSTISGTKGTLG